MGKTRINLNEVFVIGHALDLLIADREEAVDLFKDDPHWSEVVTDQLIKAYKLRAIMREAMSLEVN